MPLILIDNSEICLSWTHRFVRMGIVEEKLSVFLVLHLQVPMFFSSGGGVIILIEVSICISLITNEEYHSIFLMRPINALLL